MELNLRVSDGLRNYSHGRNQDRVGKSTIFRYLFAVFRK